MGDDDMMPGDEQDSSSDTPVIKGGSINEDGDTMGGDMEDEKLATPDSDTEAEEPVKAASLGFSDDGKEDKDDEDDEEVM